MRRTFGGEKRLEDARQRLRRQCPSRCRKFPRRHKCPPPAARCGPASASVSSTLRVCTVIWPVPLAPNDSTAFSKILVRACCTLASSYRAAYKARSSVSSSRTARRAAFCEKLPRTGCTTAFRLPAGARRVSFSCRLNSASSLAISAARCRRFFHFQQRAPPRMLRLRLAQQQRGVRQHAGQRVVEIQRHRARQLQHAVQFLLQAPRRPAPCAGDFRRRFGRPVPAASPRQQLQHEPFLSVAG